MASKTKKAREAKVRASRARSRVVARRRSRAEIARHESRDKLAATYARARERFGSHAARATDSVPPVREKKEAEWDDRKKEKKRERTRSLKPGTLVRRDAGKKNAGPKKSGSGEDGWEQARADGTERSPAPLAGGTRDVKRKSKKKGGEKEHPFHRGIKSTRLKRRAEKARDGGDISMRREGSELAAGGEGKKRRFETRNARIALLGSLLVISLAALLWVYTGTGVLNIKTVEVEGNEKLDSAYLRTLSGITGQSHLLKMDVKAVESALLSEPYVAAVDVNRIFPNKVVLDITERRPTAFILQNGVYSLVDGEGVILESVVDRPQGLVEIKDLDLPLLLPGSAIDDADFAMVNSLLANLPPSLQGMAAAAGYIEGEGLYIESGGTVVIYGDASELEYKNTVALLALTNLMQRYGAAEYIDISFPERPVIKPR